MAVANAGGATLIGTRECACLQDQIGTVRGDGGRRRKDGVEGADDDDDDVEEEEEEEEEEEAEERPRSVFISLWPHRCSAATEEDADADAILHKIDDFLPPSLVQIVLGQNCC